MTKDQAKSIFGSNSEIARALGVTRAAITYWMQKDGDLLDERIADRLLGAAVRLGKPVPKGLVARKKTN